MTLLMSVRAPEAMGPRRRFSVSKWLCALTLAGVCAACGGPKSGQPATGGTTEEGTSTSAAAEHEKKPELPVYREVTIPAGTTLRLDLQSAVASDASQVEDTVRASLRQAVTVDGQTVLPSGTELVGTVTDVARSGRVKGRARVAYRFSSLRHDSERYPIATAQISHEAQATKRKDATKIGVGAGVGAAVGAIVGGGSGAAKGAAIGGAAGTGAVLATRGDEVRLGPGANVNTRLTAPVTVRVRM
jgi:hypothetical protein